VRRAIVTSYVSYHDAPARPEQPFADFERLDVHALPATSWKRMQLWSCCVLSTARRFWARRHQFRRFPTRAACWSSSTRPAGAGSRVADGRPGAPRIFCLGRCRRTRWRMASVRTRSTGTVRVRAGATTDTWHRQPGAEVVVATARGDAWLYLDRQSANGVILAATNLDLDTHAFQGSDVAHRLLQRVLVWAEAEQTFWRSLALGERRALPASSAGSLPAGLL
jgi:hypothetical protein